MSCGTTLSNPIITINLIMNVKDSPKKFIFIGDELNDTIKSILAKIESNKSLTDKEESMMKDFGIVKKYKEWIKYKDVKFIYDYIRLDDSVNYIKKKIFLYLSDPNSKYYILEKNQELWIEPSDKTYKILGYHYVDKDTEEILKMKPSVYTKVEIDDEFVDKDGFPKDKYNLVNEDLILFDAIDLTNEREHEIYLYNFLDFKKRLDKHGIEIDDKLINGYIKKYWPDFKLDLVDVIKNYRNIKLNIERDNKIINLINNAKIDKDQFSSCNIMHTRIHINYDNTDVKIDLLKLFNYLRKNLSYDMPFIKFKDPDWIKPYSIVYDKAIKEKKIDESKLIQWLGLGKIKEFGEIKAAKGITIKIKIYAFKDKYYYGTLNIDEKGRIEFTPSFISDFGATIYDVIDAIEKISDLIKMINKSDILLDKKMEEPGAKFENNMIILKKNTKILSFTTIGDFTPSKQINYKDLFTFSKLFTPYISYKLDKSPTESRLTLLYKRVSNFVNMNDIYKKINELINIGTSDYKILSEIIDNYDKTPKEATYLLSDYKKRYGGYSSYNLMKQTGISSCINFNTNRLTVNGAPEFFLLVNANKFLMAMLTIYENHAIYAKNKNYRYLLSTGNEYIKLQEKENKELISELGENIDEEIDLEDIENLDENINVNASYMNMNYDKYLEEVNKANEELDTGITKNIEKEMISQAQEDLAKDDEIDPNIKLTCEDALPEIDTCKDLCNDRSYFLRRLQRHDTKLFKYNVSDSKKYLKYSKACQANNDFQPIVMRHNPEDDKNIDRNSFTFALKYGSTSSNQNYYICPKAWCPYCQQPVLFEKIKNIRKRMTVEGRCTVGTCPNGDHEVFIFTKGPYTESKYDHGLYPGFTSSMHPDNLCLPCCFRKPQNIPSASKYSHFMKCLGEETKDTGSEENIRYILGNIKFLSENRFGLLPPEIAKIFDTKCEQGFIKESCYLRKGVEYYENQGFLSCMADIASEPEGKPISVDELKDYLADKLTDKLFKSLNGGSLELLFKLRDKKTTPLENFKNFLKSDEKIDEKYLWDYLSRPDILFPEGMNIIIFTEETVICPVGLNVKEFYNFSKRNVFIIKYAKRYTPIYYVKYDDGEISFQKYFSAMNKTVSYVLSLLQNNCLEITSIDWKRIFKDNEKKYGIQYDIDLAKEFTLKQTLSLLGNIKVKYQLVDFYNKCVAVLLENGTYLPILPSPITLNLEILLMDNIKLLDYKVLKMNLDDIDKKTKINCKPSYKILSPDNKYIIAIILNTGRIVPVKDTPVLSIKDNIPVKDIPYYKDADRAIYEESFEPDKRTDTVNKMEFENESYNRIRFELSKYLKKHNNKLDILKKIVENNETLIKKRKEVHNVLVPIIDELVSTKSKNIDFATYSIPNLRTVCFENNNCNNDPHCIKDGNKCKLFIFSKNLITGKNNIKTYLEILVEELVRNRMKREDIFDDKISEIIDKQKLDEEDNEIIFFGKYKNDFDKLVDLYHKEQHIYINNLQLFDTLEPKHYGVEKEYLEVGLITDEAIHLEPLSIYWTNILGDTYNLFKTKDGSLFDAIAKGLNYISENSDEKITGMKLRQKVSEYDVPENVIFEIANKMKLKIHDDSNNEQDLILKLYKKYDPKVYKDISTVPDLKSYISKQAYLGCLVDIYLLSILYNINIILLDKRLKKDSIGITIIEAPESRNYILLYSQFSKDRYLYDIIVSNGRYVFEKYNFSDRFRELVNEIEDKKELPKIEAKIIGKKFKIKNVNTKTRKLKIKSIPISNQTRTRKLKIKK